MIQLDQEEWKELKFPSHLLSVEDRPVFADMLIKSVCSMDRTPQAGTEAAGHVRFQRGFTGHLGRLA